MGEASKFGSSSIWVGAVECIGRTADILGVTSKFGSSSHLGGVYAGKAWPQWASVHTSQPTSTYCVWCFLLCDSHNTTDKWSVYCMSWHDDICFINCIDIQQNNTGTSDVNHHPPSTTIVLLHGMEAESEVTVSYGGLLHTGLTYIVSCIFYCLTIYTHNTTDKWSVYCMSQHMLTCELTLNKTTVAHLM